MKNLKIYIGVLGLAILNNACNFLDVKPFNVKPVSTILYKADDVQSIVNGGFGSLQGGSFYGGYLQRASELLADNFDLGYKASNNQFEEADFVSHNFGAFNNYLGRMWGSGYSAIYAANTAINALDKNVKDGTPAQRRNIRGEALFIRATAHFELVRLYALPYTADNGSHPGIPLRTRYYQANADSIKTAKIGRSSVAEVYDQVIADYGAAAKLLPQKWDSVTVGKPGFWTVKAMLARVYFNKGDYDRAFALADSVINYSKVTFPAGPKDRLIKPYLSDNKTQPYTLGSLWTIVNTASSNGAGPLQDAFGPSPYTDIITNTLNYNATLLPIDSTGKCWADFVSIGGDYISNKVYAQRFASIPNGNNDRIAYRKYHQEQSTVVQNVPIIRLAEMYLTRAEARLQTGQGTVADAMADVTAVLTVANVTKIPAITVKEDALAFIRKVRRCELIEENDRYHELRRLQSNDLNGRGGMSYNDASKLLKLPQSEINGNPDIVQNN